jgi:Pvc16 N-terminal domain
MSNHLAVAHVTAALRRLVVASGALIGMGESDIMFGRPQAPDKGARINIYLYNVGHHSALRNADLPFRRGDTLVQRPQAALILHYLISFYGKDDELQPARMMAPVVRDLHAHAVLEPEFIEQARTGHGDILTGSNLGQSNHRIILTPQFLSLEEMSRLWSVMVQAPYALSVAYEAAVVVLDAVETAPAPLPALRRGDDDRGPEAQAVPFPRIDSIWIGFPAAAERVPPPQSLRAAQLGARLLVEGTGLAGDSLRLEFEHRDMAAVILPIGAGQPIDVLLPNDPAAQTGWTAGLYSLTAVVTRGGREQRSATWPLALAPRILGMTPPTATAGSPTTLILTCSPAVREPQSAQLLIGDLEVAAEPRLATTDLISFKFVPTSAMNGQLLILRIDGVDSQPILFNAANGTFAFDDGQRLAVTP